MSSKQIAKDVNKKPKRTVTKVIKQKMEKEEPEVNLTKKNKTIEKQKVSKENVQVINLDKKKQTEVIKDENNDEKKSKFELQIETIKQDIKLVKETLQTLTLNLKSLELAYNQDVKQAKKNAKKQKREKKSGFETAKVVPDKLAEFLEVPKGSELARPDVAKKVWQKLRERGLISEQDKRVFKTDKLVTEIFGVPVSVNKITESRNKAGFNFYNLQKYIKNAYANENKKEKKDNK